MEHILEAKRLARVINGAIFGWRRAASSSNRMPTEVCAFKHREARYDRVSRSAVRWTKIENWGEKERELWYTALDSGLGWGGEREGDDEIDRTCWWIYYWNCDWRLGDVSLCFVFGVKVDFWKLSLTLLGDFILVHIFNNYYLTKSFNFLIYFPRYLPNWIRIAPRTLDKVWRLYSVTRLPFSNKRLSAHTIIINIHTNMTYFFGQTFVPNKISWELFTRTTVNTI